MSMRKRPSLWEKIVAATMCLALNSASLAQQSSQAPQAPAGQQSTPEAPAPATPQPEAAPPSIAQQAKSLDGPPAPAGQLAPFHVELPHSRNPLAPYRPSTVPAVDLTNSPRLESLERDGKLYLSLRDAVALALENNLDLAYFRYNLPIAQSDLARTKAGGQANGVNTNIVQGTQGGFSSSGVGGGGGGGGGAVAGGAGGMVQSTLGAGAPIIPFDPQVAVRGYVDHQTLVQVNPIQSGVPVLKTNTIELLSSYSQAYPLGTNFTVTDYGFRSTTNSVFNILSPQLTANFNFTIAQPLLQGFGLATNERYIHIAKQNLR